MPKESLFHLTFGLQYFLHSNQKSIFEKTVLKLEQLYMRNSQISSVNSKFETWGLEKANLKVIDLSENRNTDKNPGKLIQNPGKPIQKFSQNFYSSFKGSKQLFQN